MKLVKSLYASIALSGLLISCSGQGAPEQGLPAGSQVSVSAAARLVTLDVKQAPLTAVLAELGRQAQLTASVPEDLKYELLTLSFQDLSLEEALTRVLAGYSFTFQYKPEQGRDVIAGVQLFAKGTPPPAAVAPSASAGNLPANPAMQMMAQVLKSHGLTNLPTLAQPPGAWGHGERGMKAASAESFDRELPFDDLKRSFSEAQDPAVRSEMLDALASRAEDEAKPVWPVLANALADRDEAVREAALNLMQSSSDPVPIGPLAMMATNDKNPDLRMDAMTLMTDQLLLDGRTKEEWAAVQASLTRSLSDPDPDIREQAAMLLADFNTSAQPVSKGRIL